MQGLILAAGMGNRLGKFTKDNTKCMVELNGKKLIDYTLEALIKVGIKKVIIVIGYEGLKLKNYLSKRHPMIEKIYVENKIYDKTNNIYSLWLAKSYLEEDDTILLESDLIFEKDILENLIKSPDKNLAVVSKYERWMDGTVALLDEKDKIISFIPGSSFDWRNTKDYYKTVNIYKFSKEFSKNTYNPFLEAYIKTMGENEYYEQVLRVIAHLGNVDFKAHRLNNELWYEVDDAQDLDIASTIFSEGKEKLFKMQKRYGGYWRFPKLKDFCYLVNPYFPNKKLVDELKYNFNTLLSEYPSGLSVQNLLAAKLFKCDEDKILVGNGAAELIKILIDEIEGKIGVIFPTFNEYPQRIGAERLEKYIPLNDDFAYSVSDLIEFSKKIGTLILINPDNPSGHLLNRDELIELLEDFNKNNKKLILDESFVDFAEDSDMSFIKDEILEKYHNLIVVKSISKSYGVPGLRLGVVASSNRELLEKIRKEIPVWNINSFGEYFLQIFGKYSKSYLQACANIKQERTRFYNELKEIPFLRVIPSNSNYFLCEVIQDFTSEELTLKLLEEYNILIKDCLGKVGFENKNFVRIAVKGEEDNNCIVSAFKAMISKDKI